jgi:hypothetical protein
MNPDIIITHNRIPDRVSIEGNEYSAYITLGLDKHEDYYIKIEFVQLDQYSFKIINKLSIEPRALTFTSNIVEKESYNITHLVVEKMQAAFPYEMAWECSSDDPSIYPV